GAGELTAQCDAPDPKIVSKAWNDAKVDAHHAIVPTEKVANLSALSQAERQIYLQLARQYLAQFYPVYRYHETQVEVEIAGGHFHTKAKQEIALGWKQLFPKRSDDKAENEGEEGLAQLPPLHKGQALHSGLGELIEKQTQPPKAFTDATLLSAMTGISRYVTNAEIRKILKETDGLGTEATRAGIIELLFKRGFLARQGKSIVSTAVGRGLINSLPESATTPDMTALWESHLDAISRKEAKYLTFMTPLIESLNGLIMQAGAQLPKALQGVEAPKSQFKKRGYGNRRGSTAGGKGNTSGKNSGAAKGSAKTASKGNARGTAKPRSSKARA
uniref:DNA topoisomerase n=1 Tax=Shewanella sp. TaxID=50422 RepID=UPI003D124FF2